MSKCWVRNNAGPSSTLMGHGSCFDLTRKVLHVLLACGSLGARGIYMSVFCDMPMFSSREGLAACKKTAYHRIPTTQHFIFALRCFEDPRPGNYLAVEGIQERHHIHMHVPSLCELLCSHRDVRCWVLDHEDLLQKHLVNRLGADLGGPAVQKHPRTASRRATHHHGQPQTNFPASGLNRRCKI